MDVCVFISFTVYTFIVFFFAGGALLKVEQIWKEVIYFLYGLKCSVSY